MESQEPHLVFSQNLRRLMCDKRVRLSHLAREVGVPKSTIHDWMHGGQPRDLVALKKLADYFSVSVDRLCFGNIGFESQGDQTSVQYSKETGLNIGSFDVILLRRQK